MTPGKKRLGLTVKNFLEEDRERAKEYECIVCKLIFSNNSINHKIKITQ